jgi:RNA polymerase sigma-70 factor (ECF subfamily)
MADDTLTDEALIVRIAENDSEAISAFYDRWFPQFTRLARRLTGSDHAGEDIAQDAIVRVIMGANKYQRGRSPRSWLLSIVYHLVQDWGRRNKVRKAASLSESGESDDGGQRAIEVAGREPSAEEKAFAREREAAVQAALMRLSHEDREVILLRDYEGLSGIETAQVLGISVDKVGSRLFRARRRLGVLLQSEWPGLFPPQEL